MKGRVHRKEQLSTFRGMKGEDQVAKTKEISEELFWLRFKKDGGQLDKPTELRKAKKALARMLTIRNETTKGKNKEAES